MKITKGPFKGKEIVYAATKEVSRLDSQIHQLLVLIGKYMTETHTPEEWAEYCFVSDESRLGDFGLEDLEVDELAKILGFSVAQKDYMYEIAMKIKGVN